MLDAESTTKDVSGSSLGTAVELSDLFEHRTDGVGPSASSFL